MSRMASADDARPRVEVVFDGRLTSPTVEARALEEARIIWAAYGVDISVYGSHGCGPGNATAIRVTLDDAADGKSTGGVLGSIRFLDGVPERAIALYPRITAALLSLTPAGQLFVDTPGVLRDLILGRALGRALAHEIGHFLLRSQQHSAFGLMRALQPTADLIEPDPRHFRLSAADVRRLAAMTSPSSQPSGSFACGD